MAKNPKAEQTGRQGGNGVSLLFLLFLGLKLGGAISWSWWWVTAPLWGPAAFVLLLFLLVGIATAFSSD